MGALADRAFGPAGLQEAWEDVLGNDLTGDHGLSRAVKRFAARDCGARLAVISDRLLTGHYRPGPLTARTATTGTKQRELHIPTVEDRIVARAILTATSGRVDPLLGVASYAYRPGLGVRDAVQRVVDLRDQGYAWVLRADVRDCFPHVPAPTAVARFRAAVADETISDVVDLLTRRPVHGRRPSPLTGVPQGCPLSPLLANLVLVDLDVALSDAGFPSVRYADDFTVLALSRDQLKSALVIARVTLEGLGMELNEEKTATMDFAEGFAFLGEEFGPRYPPHEPDHRVPEPLDRVVYVAQPGGRISLKRGRLLVTRPDDSVALDVPSGQVARLVSFGSTGVSAGLRAWALTQGIDVVLASRRGGFLGTMTGDHSIARAERLMDQCRFVDSPAALDLGRRIVAAKISHQVAVLRHFTRPECAAAVNSAIEQMKASAAALPSATDTDQLMGLEGAAAKAYFPAYGALMPEGLRFTIRSRRPPLDVANAALSYLYTILLGECVTALRAAGLDPALGALHGLSQRRPSLALDLMEEFRPMVADQVVMSTARHRGLTAEHARTTTGETGVLIGREGLEAVVKAYETRMLTEVAGAADGFSGSIRRHVYRQAQAVRATVCGGTPWQGLSWR